MIPVILSGGSGTRLWPVSRPSFPKQFCNLLDESLFVKTAKRLQSLGDPWVITTGSLKVLTEKAVGDLKLNPQHVLYEPFGNNTGPAVALLCRYLELLGKDQEIVGVFPADHLIEDENEFRSCVRRAESWAEKDQIVTLGVKPTHPATGYGYIQTSALPTDKIARRAIAFHEKPKLEAAKRFVSSGDFFWNAGMFVFRVSFMVQLLKTLAPDLYKPFLDLKSDLSNLDAVYKNSKNISIDYAIMEKLKEHVCVPCGFDWNDVGSWDAIASIQSSSMDPNIIDNSQSNFVHPVPEKTYSFIGIENLVIVDTPDALLIAKKGESEKVKDLVDLMKQRGLQSAVAHSFDFRPWGYFEVLKDTADFKSKVLRVDPGQKISYQSHAKRSEHWITVSGVGEVILDDKVIPIRHGSYTFIPQGSKHRVINTGKDALEIVEVQLGTYFGEDDIVRYSDDYGRN